MHNCPLCTPLPRKVGLEYLVICVLILITVTSSLNTSLHTHAQTLSLLALQKATLNLPFQLISPGRNLIKRGPLVQIERNHGPVDREFLLFSDCLIWLAPADASSSSWGWSGSGSGTSHNSQISFLSRPVPPTRTRSKSDAALATTRTVTDGEESIGPSPSTPASPAKAGRRRSYYHVEPPPLGMGKRSISGDDKWVYKGHADLVDVEVVVGSALEDERRFEILSPGESFAVYAGIYPDVKIARILITVLFQALGKDEINGHPKSGPLSSSCSSR